MAAGILQLERTDVGSGPALHDLRTDLGEVHDVSAEHPEVIAELTGLHHAWRATMG